MDMLDELRTYLKTKRITSDNIGEIRRDLFVPWESQWNAAVREETAALETKPHIAENADAFKAYINSTPLLLLNRDWVCWMLDTLALAGDRKLNPEWLRAKAKFVGDGEPPMIV